MAFLTELPPLTDVRFARVSARRLLVREVLAPPAECRPVLRAGAFCLNCPELNDPERSGRWEVLTAEDGDTEGLLRTLGASKAQGAIPSVVGRPRSRHELSARQSTALRIAYHLGFFDHPRRSDLASVAGALGISRSSALELLRRGMSKLAAQEEEGSSLPELTGRP